MKHNIKRHLDKLGIASQFILTNTINRAKITVYTNLLKQMNAKIRRDLYRITYDKEFAGTMCVGVDVVKAGRKSLIGMTASYSRHLTQHFCRVKD